MTKLTFHEFLKNICLFFERKQPTLDTEEQWYPSVEHIPAESLEWIGDKIKQFDSFPKNLPGAVIKLWYAWYDANPDKHAPERPLGCENCFEGYIYVSYFDRNLGHWYDTTFRCAYCRPKYPQKMAMATLEELIDKGFCQPQSSVKFSYCNQLPNKKDSIQSKHFKPTPVDDIVDEISENMEYPF